MFVLYVTHLRTGFLQLLTFPSRRDRALYMITIAEQPVALRTKDYE